MEQRNVSGRWSELRLVVQRPASHNAVWSVAVRTVEGGLRRDRLIARGTIPCAPGSAASTQWWSALHDALEAASKSLGT